MHRSPSIFLFPLLLSALVAGCPTPTMTDAGTDVPTSDTPASDAPRDVPVVLDAGTDAPVMADAPTDAGPDPLPPITNPDPHLVPISADGHDRFYAVAFAPDSSFYVAGVAADSTDPTADFRTVVAHFDAAGDLDTDFGTAGTFSRNITVGTNGEIPRGIALESDGDIVVSLTVEAVGAADARDRNAAVLRLLPDGTADATFGVDGVRIVDLSAGEVDGTSFTADSGYGIAVDAMDRILVAGSRKRDGGTDADFVVFRLAAADGALDATFGTGGVFSLDLSNAGASARSVHVLPSGRILGGGYYNLSGSIRPVVYALTDAGVLDTTFGTAGVYTEVVLTAQAEVYDIAFQGDRIVTTGYGRELAPDDNDFLSLRLSSAGVRDTTYGTAGVALLSGFDFADNARALVVLPDLRTLHVGALRSSATEADAAMVLLGVDGAPDTAFDGDGVRLVGLASGTVDHFWATDVDPRGERVVVVGIAGTNPATDDDGLVYLLAIP